MDTFTLRVVRVEEDYFGGGIWGYHIFLGGGDVSEKGIGVAAPIRLFCKAKEAADNFRFGSNVIISFETER